MTDLEIARRKDLTDRFEAVRNYFHEVHDLVPNANLFLNKTILNAPPIEGEAYLVALENKKVEVDDNRNAVKYKEQRKNEYPLVGEQLDSIYKSFVYMKSQGIDLGVDGDKWIQDLGAVKTKYPKPDNT